MLTGIDKIAYGVEDLPECVRFLRDWGLSPVVADDDHAAFRTLDGTEVELRPVADPALPPAFESGTTLRRVVWGVGDARQLDTLCERLARYTEVEDDDGDPSCDDPSGLRLSFRVSRRRSVESAGSATNTASRIDRVNRRARVYERAEPVSISHVSAVTPDVMESVEFYTDALGFVVSDCYPDSDYFLRCAPEGVHHSLVLHQIPNRKRGLHHVAFAVRDLHEVFGGGLHVDRCGWKTQMGPGRHVISSAYFWYVRSPVGVVEYCADEDWCTADWKAEAWEHAPEVFAEWAVVGGIDGTTRRQFRKQDQ